ncbi:MAG: hypothetical protein LWW86_16335 [Micrococcales bacterium]|nr:hypothetical protein [Micrococcales bacterium]
MTTPEEAPFHLEGVRDALEEIQGLVGEMTSMSRDYAEELRDFREQMAAAHRQRAEQARAGELGSEWQQLQRRIDLGETSVDALLRGTDGSPEARSLRETIVANTEVLAEMQETEPDQDEPDELGDSFAAVRRNQQDLRELVREIRAIRVDDGL